MDSTNRLLTAFDKVANSNSFLLKAPEKEGDLKRRFLYFVPSRAFKREMIAADIERDWHNYHTIGNDLKWRPHGGGFYKGSHITFEEPLDAKEFGSRLISLLNEGPCFYGKRYPVQEVKTIVDDFLRDQNPDNNEVVEVQPDFLFSHDYLGRLSEEKPDKALCYFDGCGCDYCFCWLSGGELRVLLLNGTS